VDVVAADVEEMNVFTGVGGVGGLFGELGEVGEGEGLKALGGVAENVAWALFGWLGVGSLNGGEGGRFCSGGFCCSGLESEEVWVYEGACGYGRCEGEGGGFNAGWGFDGGL